MCVLSGTTQVSRYQKDKPFWILLKQDKMRWQWHQLNHMQIICASLQTDNHASTSSVRFLRAGYPAWHPTNSVKALPVTDVNYTKTCKPASKCTQTHTHTLFFPVKILLLSVSRLTENQVINSGNYKCVWYSMPNDDYKRGRCVSSFGFMVSLVEDSYTI